MSAPKRSIVRANADYFLIRVVPEDGPDGKYVAVHREQVASFFSYDKAIRRREKRYPEVPIGYHQFREAFSREAKTNARFAYRELNGQGGTHVVEPGPPPSKDEVLGGSADLRSPEERDGGQLMTKRQVSTVNGMLWELAEQTQRKKEWSHQRYLDRHTRREDRCHDRDPTTDQRSHSPGGGSVAQARLGSKAAARARLWRAHGLRYLKPSREPGQALYRAQPGLRPRPEHERWTKRNRARWALKAFSTWTIEAIGHTDIVGSLDLSSKTDPPTMAISVPHCHIHPYARKHEDQLNRGPVFELGVILASGAILQQTTHCSESTRAAVRSSGSLSTYGSDDACTVNGHCSAYDWEVSRWHIQHVCQPPVFRANLSMDEKKTIDPLVLRSSGGCRRLDLPSERRGTTLWVMGHSCEVLVVVMSAEIARQHSHKAAASGRGSRLLKRSDRRHEKSRATDAAPDTPSTVYAPLEASSTTDVASAQEVTVNVPPAQTETAAPINNQPGPSSQTLGSYFTEVEFYTNMLPGPSSVGTSAMALDEASFSETMEMAGEGETYEFTEDGVDESMEPGNSAEGAV
ncbi:hypothetical protein EDD15DRAFT_2459915 [Pisolithus albus]|nr:hypothetical protein EDD15DRAFT_2459915 [Pisolithus albus]